MQSELVSLELTVVLKNLRRLHGEHAFLTGVQAVQVRLCDALGADEATELGHLAQLLHVRVVIAHLAVY